MSSILSWPWYPYGFQFLNYVCKYRNAVTACNHNYFWKIVRFCMSSVPQGGIPIRITRLKFWFHLQQRTFTRVLLFSFATWFQVSLWHILYPLYWFLDSVCLFTWALVGAEWCHGCDRVRIGQHSERKESALVRSTLLCFWNAGGPTGENRRLWNSML